MVRLETTSRRTPRRRRRAGFSLMEALVVVAIIGITAALATPGVRAAMAERRAGEATHALVRLGARARSEAMAYGRAHVIVYSQASGGTPATNGSAQLWRGRVNLCTANDWAVIMAGACGSDVDCVDALDMGSYNYGTHQVRMRIVGGGNTWLCFQPDGEVLFSTNAGATFAPTPPGGGSGAQFTFTRLVDGRTEGVQRTVVFPLGGAPRIVR